MVKSSKSQRLKVYRTRIGFHDWIVAAPNQKAALEAWDVRENLFAQGAASVATDEELVQLALRSPGEPVAVDRGKASAEARKVIRLDQARSGRTAPRPTRVEKPKPHRLQLDRAENALDEFRRRAIRERAAILRERKSLDRRAQLLEQELEEERIRLERALEVARARYDSES
jgi:colicin import membrane protein